MDSRYLELALREDQEDIEETINSGGAILIKKNVPSMFQIPEEDL